MPPSSLTLVRFDALKAPLVSKARLSGPSTCLKPVLDISCRPPATDGIKGRVVDMEESEEGAEEGLELGFSDEVGERGDETK